MEKKKKVKNSQESSILILQVRTRILHYDSFVSGAKLRNSISHPFRHLENGMAQIIHYFCTYRRERGIRRGIRVTSARKILSRSEKDSNGNTQTRNETYFDKKGGKCTRRELSFRDLRDEIIPYREQSRQFYAILSQ